MIDYLRMRNDRRNGRDMRNPYGSRGGYVTSDRQMRSQHDYDYEDDDDDNEEIDNNYPYRNDRAMNNINQGNRQQGRGGRSQGSRDGHYRMYYPNEWGMYDYGNRYDLEYNEMDNMKLSNRELKSWKKKLENADGTRGEKFNMEQILPISEQMNIRFNDFTEEELAMVVNLLYSDYCKVLGADLSLYIKMAKAFLEDKDFDGSGSEKLALYYHSIASEE